MTESKTKLLKELDATQAWLRSVSDDLKKETIGMSFKYTTVTDDGSVLSDVSISSAKDYTKLFIRDFLNLRRVMGWDKLPLEESLERIYPMLKDMEKLGLIKELMTDEDYKGTSESAKL